MELFHEPKMQVFNGMMTAIVQTNGKPGDIILTASGKGLKSNKIVIKAE
jgi:beta-galactosidase